MSATRHETTSSNGMIAAPADDHNRAILADPDDLAAYDGLPGGRPETINWRLQHVPQLVARAPPLEVDQLSPWKRDSVIVAVRPPCPAPPGRHRRAALLQLLPDRRLQ